MQNPSIYRYKATTKTGRIVRGAVAANSEMHLNRQLEEASMELITCRPVRFGAHPTLRKYTSRVTTRDLIQFFVQMEQLQAAGIPLLESLKNVRDGTGNRYLQDILIAIQRDVSEGLSFSEAMTHHDKVFDSLCISITASGEETGDMPATFRYLISHLKWTDEMNSRVRKAMRYPLVVITVVVIAVVIMMAVVVPQITQFFEYIGEGKNLPLATVALVATSEIFRAWWWALAAGITALAGVIIAGRRVSVLFARATDNILLNAPVFGSLIRKINIARFARTISALYQAGIPFVDALKTARNTLTNRIMAEAVDEVYEDMIVGKSFSQALSATGEFPAIVPLMVSTGEKTGKMGEILDQIAAFYNADVDEEIQKMITMIEPALTAILGGIILWIAVGVFGPIYELFEDLDF